MDAHRAMIALTAALLTTACNGSSSSLPPDKAATYTVSVLGGNNQVGLVNTLLPSALLVKVTNADGAVARGISVTWTVVSGGGAVPSPTITDANGQSQAPFALGNAAGFQTVNASVASAVAIGIFSAFAHDTIKDQPSGPRP